MHAGRSSGTTDLYIDALLKELSLYSGCPAVRERRLSSVYFGGGSPSFLDEGELQRLLEGLQAEMPWDSVVECTFECEPGTITEEKLRLLRRLGVTRVSLGFQTLTPDVLQHCGRHAGPEACVAACSAARNAGFGEVNVDLLAGLPGETAKSWEETMTRVIEIAPDCVTIYQLELTCNSVFHHTLPTRGPTGAPTSEEKRQWVGRAFQMLEAAGYAIGSGYMAIRNPESWRFVYTVESYWHGGDLLALGETAFGHFQGVHYQNVDSLAQYLTLVQTGCLPLQRVRRLDGEEKLRRELILQLKTGSLDRVYFRSKFGVDIGERFRQEFGDLRRRGLLEEREDGIELTREGLLQVDALLPAFYLGHPRGIHRS